MRMKLLVAAGVFTLTTVLAACGGDGSNSPGSAAEPRTIEVTTVDANVYEPASIAVDAGETVRFVVTNSSQTDHEFVVGDMEMQQMAEMQAREGSHGHTAAMASLPLGPGETDETTITFDEPGELFYACHISDHYEAGMVGTITVS